ncbi:hypothetical protein PO872_18335 [Rhizobium sp. MC62]|nr:hypothetical protein [Rhizobium sp. MC62]
MPKIKELWSNSSKSVQRFCQAKREALLPGIARKQRDRAFS